MSDYGSRGYGNGPDDYGWAGRGSSDRGGDYGRNSDYGHDRGGDYGRSDYGRGGDYGRDDYGRDDYRSSGRDSGFGPSYDNYGDDGYDNGGMRSGGYDPHDEPPTSGRAQVPGGDSSGPARGSARVGAKRRGGKDLSPEEAEALAKAKKKKKRRRRLIALGCVVVIMLGIGTVGASLFFESVPLPEDLNKALEQNSEMLYSNGDKMASIGNVNRREVTAEQIPNAIEDGLVAAEDRKFYEHDGVDFWGVMRAVWNNVTGGETQGASTLEQQYVGAVADIRNDQSYFRKAREAVMAMKLGDEMSKDKILNAYLNLMPFGRGAFGVGAAAEAFFDTPVEKLSVSQSALLVAQLKASGGTYDPRDPLGLGEDVAKANAEERWTYVLNSLVDIGKLDAADRDKILEEGLPKTEKLNNGNEDAKKNTGFVSNDYALNEAADILDLTVDQVRSGGYQITTTIDKDLQKAAKDVADYKKGEVMEAQNDNLRAALVSVDPKTGRYLAYYGGTNDGTGTDKAGYDNMHPPGSSFKEFTMQAVLKAGISINSRWDGSSPREFEHRVDGNGEPLPVSNAGDAKEPDIKLIDAVRKSLNTPIYAMTDEEHGVGANKVLETAYEMGITRIEVPDKDGNPTLWDLSSDEAQELLADDSHPRGLADNEIGFGQYPVSVRDMAVANATLANQGRYVTPHFVKSISTSEGEKIYDDEVGKYNYVTAKEVLDPDIAADVTYVASTIVPKVMIDAGTTQLANGQPVAGKTGTWEKYCECDDNSHIWYTGFTPSLSAAVWVGDKNDENGTVRESDGVSPAYGASISGAVWKAFMDKAVEKEEYSQVEQFPAPVYTGDDTKGELGAGGNPDNGGGDENGGDEGGGDEGGDTPPKDNICDPAVPGDPDCEPSDDQCPDPNNANDPDCGGDPGGGDECDPILDPNCDDNGGETPDNNGNPHPRVGTVNSAGEGTERWDEPAAMRADSATPVSASSGT